MRLLDRFFRFAAPRPNASRATLTTETALDPLQALRILGRMPDPDVALRKAGIGRTALKALEFDPEIYAAIETRREAVLAMDWRIEPAPDTGSAGEARALQVWEWLDSNISGIIQGSWQAVLYGYAVQEMIWAQTDNRDLWPDRIVAKPIEWFSPQPDGSLIYFSPHGEVTVDTTFKFLLTRRQATQMQPYGEALLSRLWWIWFLRGEGYKMWARHLERHGSPLLIGEIPAQSADAMLGQSAEEVQARMQAEADALVTALEAAVRSASIATTAKVHAVGASNGGAGFSEFASEMQRQIQRTILGQTLTSDVGGGGSYAAAKVHDMVRKDRLRADLRLIQSLIQHIINAVAVVNRWPDVPVFAWQEQTDLQLDRAERDAKLVQAGIANLTNDYLMRVYDYEEGDLAETQPAPTEPPAFAAMGRGKSQAALQFARQRGRFTARQEAVEDLADEAIAASPQPIDPKTLRGAIMGARDEADLKDRLSQLYNHQDPGFAEILARAQFTAAVLGYIHAEER